MRGAHNLAIARYFIMSYTVLLAFDRECDLLAAYTAALNNTTLHQAVVVVKGNLYM